MENIDINQIAISVADKVSSEMDIKIALIGAGGIIVGALIQATWNCLHFHLENKTKKIQNEKRKKYLLHMLEKSESWRSIGVLSAVIGTNEEETKALLIEIGARGSETKNGMWGLVKRNPLPEKDDVFS